MNYLVLFHNSDEGKVLYVRSQEKATELVELAKRGDTLHRVSEAEVLSWRSAALLELVEQQRQHGEFKQL